jgi:hypothetical protein
MRSLAHIVVAKIKGKFKLEEITCETSNRFHSQTMLAFRNVRLPARESRAQFYKER